MHPQICRFPSAAFYGNELKNGEDVEVKTRSPWHTDALLSPFRFFDVKGQEAKGRFHSLINKAEAQVAVAIYERLKQVCPREDFSYRVGVVTMYKAQVMELRTAFVQRYGANIASHVDFNTVDGFQGQEKDIIILSCVRSGPQASIGFLSDIRRLNVAITRARCSLFIVGNSDLLRRQPTWAKLVEVSQETNALEPNVSAFTLAQNIGRSAAVAPPLIGKSPNKKAARAPAPAPGPPPPKPAFAKAAATPDVSMNGMRPRTPPRPETPPRDVGKAPGATNGKPAQVAGAKRPAPNGGHVRPPKAIQLEDGAIDEEELMKPAGKRQKMDGKQQQQQNQRVEKKQKRNSNDGRPGARSPQNRQPSGKAGPGGSFKKQRQNGHGTRQGQSSSSSSAMSQQQQQQKGNQANRGRHPLPARPQQPPQPRAPSLVTPGAALLEQNGVPIHEQQLLLGQQQSSRPPHQQHQGGGSGHRRQEPGKKADPKARNALFAPTRPPVRR